MEQTIVYGWYLPDEDAANAFLTVLGKTFTLAYEPEEERTLSYYDSFDWRLFGAGYLFSCNGGKWALRDRVTGEVTLRENGPQPTEGLFADAFAEGGLRNRLQSLLEMRCVLPMASGTVTVQEVRLLNKDEKTVVRLFLELHHMEGGDQPLRALRIEPVRGYTRQLEKVHSTLKNFDPIDRPLAMLDLEQGSAGKGRTPGDYSSKFVLHLDPDQTALSAVKDIYRQLLQTMHTNLPGIIADLDSEFLHDFRVAVRRTRSGLSLIKDVLPPGVVSRFKTDFATLGKITGPTRDLDVYLLYEEEYKQRLPESLQTGLHTFFENLAQLRAKEQRSMVRALRGDRVQDILGAWGEYLESSDDAAAKYADVPVIDIAKKIIFRRYKRLLKDGLAIHAETPDQEIHRLRIQGKKLRYAIEFFSSMFPENAIGDAVRRLKKLQNYLGDFNDLSVQQKMLREYLQHTRPGSRKNLELGSALGGLLSNLHQEQVSARDQFPRVFGKFSSAKNKALFEQLFT